MRSASAPAPPETRCPVSDLQHSTPVFDADDADLWLVDLRERLVEAGHSVSNVDIAIGAALARYNAATILTFVPLLVERSVKQSLRGDVP
jgi:hypothetical protein